MKRMPQGVRESLGGGGGREARPILRIGEERGDLSKEGGWGGGGRGREVRVQGTWEGGSWQRLAKAGCQGRMGVLGRDHREWGG